ncbi:MAG: hypothetical protein IPN73_06910 [Saprospiraceae bacterium]|nr:hypothetical protein [Saprospiraceae bacterium]
MKEETHTREWGFFLKHYGHEGTLRNKGDNLSLMPLNALNACAYKTQFCSAFKKNS